MEKEIEILLKNNTKFIDLRSEKEFRKAIIKAGQDTNKPDFGRK